MADKVARIVVVKKKFLGYYTNLLHTGDTKEADNPINNTCQSFLIDVIFGCESNFGGFDLE